MTDLTLEGLARELARTTAYQQIQNVMGHYSYFMAANDHEGCLSQFALKTPGVRAEMIWGVYEGADSLRRLYPGYHVWTDGDAKGTMHLQPLSTPVIEVSADGRTAKGIWVSPGNETLAFAPGEPIGAHWAWCKYGCDFVLEDGVWKIWHLHVYGVFFTPFSTSWVDMDPSELPPPIIPEEYAPDGPTTSPVWMYSTDSVYPNEPAVPEPFDVFDDATAF